MEKKSVSVTLENVTKKFKDVKGKADVIAVNNADFVVEPGELVTLLGPSRIGKTRRCGWWQVSSCRPMARS